MNFFSERAGLCSLHAIYQEAFDSCTCKYCKMYVRIYLVVVINFIHLVTKKKPNLLLRL